MRILNPSIETRYESGFSLYTPQSGVIWTDVPISESFQTMTSPGFQPTLVFLNKVESF